MLALLLVALAVWLHNLAAPAALGASAGLTLRGRWRAGVAFAAAQAALGVLGLLAGRALLPRLPLLARQWGGITLLTAAALWALFAPAEFAAANLPVADNPDYPGAVAADGAAVAWRLWLSAFYLHLDNAVAGAGLGVGGTGAWVGALALLAAALLALPAGLSDREPDEWGLRLPRAGSYLLLAVTAMLSIGVLAL